MNRGKDNDTQGRKGRGAAAGREDRLKARLKANLARRKARARAQAAAAHERDDGKDNKDEG
ncbi:hypothetical protein [Roseovarius salinarum]|uniref:hypothetical protein n=1 Tax=Roseovarius salinarum TaxID=1981892 RepID=UPI000C323BE2|nr:hypothetical protein [Roseovarius salinarum]